MNRRTLLYFSLGLILIIVVMAIWSVRGGRNDAQPPLAGAAIGGPFSLVDQHGKPFTDKDLRGHYALVYFGYSYCPDVCPTDLARLMQGLRIFEKQDAARAAHVLPVFFTVDPERDTPQVVGQFVSAFHPRLIGLTGSTAAVQQAMQSYRIYAKRQGPPGAKDYLVDHSANAYLFDEQGRPMVLFTSTDTPQAIAATLDQWVK